MNKTAAVLNEQIQNWMDDWERDYDQTWDESKLKELIGKKINLTRPADESKDRVEKTFTFTVVGWGCNRLSDPGNKREVSQWGVLTDEGNLIHIYAGTTIEPVDSPSD